MNTEKAFQVLQEKITQMQNGKTFEQIWDSTAREGIKEVLDYYQHLIHASLNGKTRDSWEVVCDTIALELEHMSFLFPPNHVVFTQHQQYDVQDWINHTVQSLRNHNTSVALHALKKLWHVPSDYETRRS